jgi:CRP/FNR family cyclic AMP-dependent transcriptional regulator
VGSGAWIGWGHEKGTYEYLSGPLFKSDWGASGVEMDSGKESNMSGPENRHKFSHAKEVLAMLNDISIFAGLDESQLQILFQELEEVSYGQGDVIFEQGSEPSHIYIIRTGQLKLVAGDANTSLELIEFEPGDCFGETSVIGIVPHAASSVAVGNTELLVLSRKALLNYYKTDLTLFSILILNIAREACRRLSQTDEILLHYVLNQ